jgi:hypothetical protein
MKEELNNTTGEHSGASLCSEFILLMGQIECMMERAAKYRDEAEEEGDIETKGKNARVYCVLKELHRLGKCFEGSQLAKTLRDEADRYTRKSGASRELHGDSSGFFFMMG